jgi:hypothetical protein
VLVELPGEVFAGILCGDRCASYLKYHKGKGRFCWPHVERNPGHTGNRQDNRRGTLLPPRSGASCPAVPAMASFPRRIRRKIWLHRARTTDALADRYLDSCDKDVANLALRCAVQWRKISFGSRSAQGEVAVARLLAMTRTCRMQNQASLDYLVTALRSHRSALPVPSPSLLKTASTT